MTIPWSCVPRFGVNLENSPSTKLFSWALHLFEYIEMTLWTIENSSASVNAQITGRCGLEYGSGFI